MSKTPRFEPIKRFIVDAGLSSLVSNGVALRWSVHPEHCRSTLTFTILWGTSPTDTFKVIETVEDTDLYVDTTRRLVHDLASLWYAIKVEDDEGRKWYSSPQQAGSAWRNREWRVAREIARQEMVRMRKGGAGSRGFLLRRKAFGTPCPICVVPETGQVSDPDCPTCYGTGIDGGYHPPIECWVDMNPEKVFRKLDADQGLVSDKLKTFRCLAFPPLNTNDYWVSAKTGQRYRVLAQVVKIAEIEEEPIILSADVEVAQYDDVIYTFPIETT